MESMEGEFVYDSMHPSDVNWLKASAALLKKHCRNSASEMIDAGALLETAKGKLGRALWKSWLESEAQLSLRSAERLRSVAIAFDSIEPGVLNRFTPTALYTLSEPTTPQSLRRQAVEQATQGQTIKDGMVRNWMETLRKSNTAAANDQVNEGNKPANGRTDTQRDCEDDAAKAEARENWLLLDTLLKKDAMIKLRASTCDAQSAQAQVTQGQRLIEGQLMPQEEGGTWRSAIGHGTEGLESVIFDLANQEPGKKICARCRGVKPLEELSRRKDSKDGRNRYCLVCERERVKKYSRGKTANGAAVTIPVVSADSVASP
jgi:hypothetical protein